MKSVYHEREAVMSLRSNASKTEQLVMTALMMTLILVGTILLRIPIPMTQGYVHLGDAMIYLGVLLLGKKNGTAAAAIGSMMADILGGFAFWAPWTLVIKAAMAYTAGLMAEIATRRETRSGRQSGAKHLFIIVGMILGGVIMTAGYFIAEGIMYGNWPAAALGIPWNIGQFAVGIAISMTVSAAVTMARRS